MRSGKLFSGDVSLEVACEMLAELRDFEPEKLLTVARRGPRLFFPHAKQNGDRSWRIPARDMRSILGEGLPQRAVSARTFGDWCELHPTTVVRAINRGELRKVEFFGEWRIPVSEFTRLMGLPPGPARRLSFSRSAGSISQEAGSAGAGS